MATYVVKQLLGSIQSGGSFTWFMTYANPPFPDVDYNDRQPKYIVNWQAVPIFLSTNNPAGQRPGITIEPVTIIEEEDTSQTHELTLTCRDLANTGVSFVATYVLYAIFIELN